jgi:hypothetical protein
MGVVPGSELLIPNGLIVLMKARLATVMKRKSPLPLGAVLASLLIFTAIAPALAQGSLFTYQGRLNVSGNPANGLYDFRFKVFSDSYGTTQIGSSFLTNGIPATNGLFIVGVDFGPGIFTGSNYWLEVSVRANGAGSYTILDPLQPVTPTPYAIFANTASNLTGTLPASQLSGPLPNSNLTGTYGNAVTFNNASGNFSGNFSGSFSGSGSGLTGVNATTLNGLNSSSFWRTGGNTNTPPDSNYLGTADNQPLEFRVNNTRVSRFEPDTRGLYAGNIIGGYISNAVMQPGSGGDVIAGGGFSGGPNIVYSNSSGVFIGAGSANSIGPNVNDSAILGGYGNSIQAGESTIAGGGFNTNGAYNAFIGGGGNNSIQQGSLYANIVGGLYNTIQTNPSFSYSVIDGGYYNLIQSNVNFASINGGWLNTVQTNGSFSAIGGGIGNTASGLGAVVGGGGVMAYTNYTVTYKANTASGLGSVVPGGAGNSAAGNFSMAAGYRAKANQDGTFVWSDSVNSDFASTSSNQFLIRASGGVGINTTNPGTNALAVTGSAQITGPAQVAGPAQVTGLFRSGAENGTSEAPSPAGLVMRRLNSTVMTSGQVVARTDSVQLMRDGTHGGFFIFVPIGSGNVTVSCMGINNAGTPVNFYTTFPNNTTNALTQQMYFDSQNVVHFECTFGRTYDAGQHLTTINLSRYGNDFYWSGTLISTYNQ